METKLYPFTFLYVIICHSVVLITEIKYGQLPVLEVDGKELSQSLAIGRFLGKKFNFECRDEFLSAKADEVSFLVYEIVAPNPNDFSMYY